MENRVFTEPALLLGLFHFNATPFAFLDEEQAHQKWIETSGHGCEMPFAQASPSRQPREKWEEPQEAVPVKNPRHVQTKLHLQQKHFRESLPGAIPSTCLFASS